MFRSLVSSAAISCLLVSCAAPSTTYFSSPPANQLDLSANACGPTALLNAYRTGSPKWQQVATSIPGDTDEKRILSIIRQIDALPSSTPRPRRRWSSRGVSVTDLNQVANVLSHDAKMPPLSESILFLKSGESPAQLLKRSHKLLSRSYRKGLPPIISLRSYVSRKQSSGKYSWVLVGSHFVTLRDVPDKLTTGDDVFPICYIDPWGGETHQGSIRIPSRPVLAATAETSPCLEVVLPDSSLGKNRARASEVTVITLAAAIGRW
jgi:hypothetical protein